LLAKLEALGELENTLIFFLADNGASPESPKVSNVDPDAPIGSVASFEYIDRNWAQICETPLRKWKASSHEGGICTPMIVHWPKVIKPRSDWYREPAHLIDIMPTLVEITGAVYPGESKESAIPEIDGVSLLNAFKGGTQSREDPLYFQFAKGSALRNGKWKLVRSGPEWELYDFSVDRTESNNLVDEMPELVKEMSAAWNAWYVECTGEVYTAGKK
jgi:arylsulfatase